MRILFTLFTLLLLSISQRVFSEGLAFDCDQTKIKVIENQIDQYLNQLNIAPHLFHKQVTDHTLQLTLKQPDQSTLYIRWNPDYQIEDEVVELPAANGKSLATTVSKKEIVLALMQSGRRTTFSGKSCNFEAFQDHVHVRQMIVAWAEHLHWKFPDGGPAQWNETYWKNGTLKPGKPLLEAMTDFFIHQDTCAIGCYTATKIVIIQGILDYYQRIKQDTETANAIKKSLQSDGEVLVGIEPDTMWGLSSNNPTSDFNPQGKLLNVKMRVAPLNFIPGDWVYFKNTDSASANISGYEGSNSIYMGRARFDDFYDDNDHHFLYNEKLREVYNWRFGVRSRSRDYAHIHNPSSDLLNTLGNPPQAGGLVLDSRSVPKFFGFE